MDAKPTQHIEITTSKQRQFKLAFHKVGYFHPHYSTFTPQTYHHPVHRFRSWPMQMTSQSHPHTQVRVQPRNTYNHTYTLFLPGQNNLLLNPDKTTCTLFTPDPCRIYKQSGPNNKQQSTTHGNAPKGSGSYLRHQNSHTAHTSTTSQYKHTNLYKS